MSSPARGKYRARFHCPTSSNTAPCRAPTHASASCGPARTGRRGHSRRKCRTSRACRASGTSSDRLSAAAVRGRRQRSPAHSGSSLALVGGHARRRIALDVLDRLEALARRQREILARHVVLEIDECPGGGCEPGCGSAPGMPCAPNSRDAACNGRCSPPRRPARAAARPASRAVVEHGLEPFDAPARARRALAFGGALRQERWLASSQASLPRDCENRCTLGV